MITTLPEGSGMNRVRLPTVDGVVVVIKHPESNDHAEVRWIDNQGQDDWRGTFRRSTILKRLLWAVETEDLDPPQITAPYRMLFPFDQMLAQVTAARDGTDLLTHIESYNPDPPGEFRPTLHVRLSKEEQEAWAEILRQALAESI